MYRKLDWLVVLGSLLAGAIASNAWAQTNWRGLIPFEPRVEYDAKKDYWVHQGNGPWMILAASFSGENGLPQARGLVKELRTRYNLQAYLHSRDFDFTETVEGKGFEKGSQNPVKMRYLRDRVSKQVVVLVGNYETLESPALQRTLEKLKYAWPKSLEIHPEQGTSQNLAFLREMNRRLHSDEDRKRRGPMATAFAAQNPVLPKEYFSPKGLDSFVHSMNKDVENSLLGNPGRFTVKIATFRGASTMQSATGEFKLSNKLVQAAERAHALTTALRKSGVKAYEFHDRYESIVTVGSFEKVGERMADGRIELDPRVYQVMTQYGAKRQQLPNGQVGLAPRTMKGIPFDVQPQPIEVPRASIANDYRTNQLGLLR